VIGITLAKSAKKSILQQFENPSKSFLYFLTTNKHMWLKTLSLTTSHRGRYILLLLLELQLSLSSFVLSVPK